MKLTKGIITLFITILTTFSSITNACRCRPKTLRQQYHKDYNTHVMKVKILREKTKVKMGRVYRAHVQEIYKGCDVTKTITIVTASSSASCGVKLEVNSEYLITAEAKLRGSLRTHYKINSCGYNVRWSEFEKKEPSNLEFLQNREICCDGKCSCATGNIFYCLINPCETSCCEEGHVCEMNSCNGCHAEWKDKEGSPVCAPCDEEDEKDWNIPNLCDYYDEKCVGDTCRSTCKEDKNCPEGSYCGIDNLCKSKSPLPSCEKKRQYYPTCGDPVCTGHKPSSFPTCEDLGVEEGDECKEEGFFCDPVNDCNSYLKCSSTPPDLRFCPKSRRHFKRDIEYLDDSHRQILSEEILSMKLATYNYIDEPEEALAEKNKGDLTSWKKKNLGFIIDDLEPSHSVQSGDGDVVNLYGYLSMAVATIQTQQEVIETHSKEILELRQALADMNNRINHGNSIN